MERVRCPNPKCGRRILDIEEMPLVEMALESLQKTVNINDTHPIKAAGTEIEVDGSHGEFIKDSGFAYPIVLLIWEIV